MSTTGVILKNRLEYSTEKMLSDVMISVFRADICITFDSRKHYNKDGRFRSIDMTISDRPLYNEEKQDFNFWIESIEEQYIDERQDKEYDWISKGKKLYQVAYIENVQDVESTVFKFAYEYLKLNQNDYFWFEDDYSFCFDDMERLSKLPFDPDWCYKNPKLL